MRIALFNKAIPNTPSPMVTCVQVWFEHPGSAFMLGLCPACVLTAAVLERDADALGAEGADFLMEDGGLAEA